MYRMYRRDTAQGICAVNLLNPFVMQRETTPENFSKAEQPERIVYYADQKARILSLCTPYTKV